MHKFYLLLWLNWLIGVALLTLASGFVLALVITFGFYLFSSAASFSQDVIQALGEIFRVTFFVSLNLTLLLALFIRLKFLFNRCFGGYKLQLMACNLSDTIEVIGYGDMVRVWRKWFMLMVWLVGSCMVVALGISTLLLSYESLFDWFSLYWLYGFIALSGYVSFMILSARCKKVRIVAC